MIVKTITSGAIQKLYLAIDANLSSFRKRSMLYTISAHSENVAGVMLYVTGKKGTVVKELILIYNLETLMWDIYSEGKIYSINSLSEISAIVRTMIQTMAVTVNKI